MGGHLSACHNQTWHWHDTTSRAFWVFSVVIIPSWRMAWAGRGQSRGHHVVPFTCTEVEVLAEGPSAILERRRRMACKAHNGLQAPGSNLSNIKAGRPPSEPLCPFLFRSYPTDAYVSANTGTNTAAHCAQNATQWGRRSASTDKPPVFKDGLHMYARRRSESGTKVSS
jgi:hypothetical protein